MDLGNKLLELRKKSGFSQEILAEKLEVSRQTISKWELNESSPDIKQAKVLSKIYKVSLDELVNNDISSIIVEKISNTERLAKLTIKIIKGIGILMLITMILIIFYFLTRTKAWFIGGETTLECSFDGESYRININHYENNDYNKEVGLKNHWSCSNCDLEILTNIKKYLNYDDLNETTMFVNAYFESLGGTCQ